MGVEHRGDLVAQRQTADAHGSLQRAMSESHTAFLRTAEASFAGLTAMMLGQQAPATEQEVRAASLQFVRKLSGFNKPSQANEAAFNQAIEEVAAAARTLMSSLSTSAPPRYREFEIAKARERARLRFGR